MSAHATLANAIRAGVPATWRIVDHERDTDEPDATAPATVTIKLDSVRRLPEAPASGVYLAAWTLTIATPHTDPERADPEVFDRLLELVDHLDGLDWLRWTTAQKVLAGGRYAFDITIETQTTRESETP